MRKSIYLLAASLIFTLAACSESDQNIVSPFETQVEKRAVNTSSLPYELYQSFVELNDASISWQNEKQGLAIYIDAFKKTATHQLFATIDLLNGKGTTMVFLGYSNNSKFIINGISVKDVSSIRIFKPDFVTDNINGVYPYPVSQVFENLAVKGWSDGGTDVKIYTATLPQKINQMFGMLIAREGVQLIFLGNPGREDFVFPKSENLHLKDIKLFTYQK